MVGYGERVEVQMVNFCRALSEKVRRRYAAVEAVKLEDGGVAYFEMVRQYIQEEVNHERDQNWGLVRRQELP